MNIFLNDIKKIIIKNNLELISDNLLSILLNHINNEDRTEIFNTDFNTLYLCGNLKIKNNQTNELLIGEQIKSYFENKGFKNKDLIFILSNQNIIEKHGFTIKSSPFFEIVNNKNYDDVSQPFNIIPTKNLDVFINEEN